MIRILEPGPLATLQDLGRAGWAHLGVAASGAADRAAHRHANRLVGNPEGATTIEVTMGGLVVALEGPAVIALSGAPSPARVEGGPPLGHDAPSAMPAGAVVRLGSPARGLRSYLAVRGGILSPRHLGSSSTDTLGGLGPAPLRRDHLLEVGPDPGGALVGEPTPARARWADEVGDVELLLHPGPRAGHVALDRLVAQSLLVSADVSRVGVRLDPPHPLVPRGPELASEGILPGAVQVPPDGRPIVFLVDHPVTGGYPVVAVVEPSHLDRVAQLRPGDTVRFRWHR